MLVVPDWFHNMPLQQQSVALLAGRGPDGIAKDHPCKAVVRAYRGTIFRAGKYGRFLEFGEEADTFMSLERFGVDSLWNADMKVYFDHVDSLPHHYHLHLMHGAQVIGQHHPDNQFRDNWFRFYLWCCQDMHVPPEQPDDMAERLGDWGREFWNHKSLPFDNKCIVKGCGNTSDQGSFVGMTCAPCFEMLTEGKTHGSTNSFIGKLQHRLDAIEKIFHDVDDESMAIGKGVSLDPPRIKPEQIWRIYELAKKQ